MTRESIRRQAEELFQRTVDLPTEQRTDFLREHCGLDNALFDEVASLLHHFGRRAVPSLEALDLEDDPDWIGERIGPYKVLERIGEGGFGLVFMAEQESPIRRRVALKVIKAGMDTRQVIARFEAEREALALMDHPSIAKVLDAGSTDAGRPYFVMELVRGLPITEYCDAYRIPLRDRLKLFTQVCGAVQHAHLKGIIHRDLKPSNVLVTLQGGTAVPKVIDFGVAKAVDRRLTEKTLFTGFRQFIGTPEYMSPEQTGLSGVDVDTRADVYALGVLLYTLLTGRTPFERQALAHAAFEEIQRIIRDEDPPTPSTRVSRLGEDLDEVAASRGVAPATLGRMIRGELDWIVMKALEKDRDRRYESAANLATDVDRYLRHEPVAAGPPGAFYKLGRLARRHRVAVGVTLAILLGLVGGLAFALVGFLEASRARDDLANERDLTRAALGREAAERRCAETSARRARSEADKCKAVSDFLHQTLSSVNPWFIPNEQLRVRALLDRASTRLGQGALRGQPEAEASVRMTLGMTYTSLGLLSAAERHFARTADLHARTLGEEALETIEARLAQGTCLQRLGKVDEAERLVARAVALLGRHHGEEHPRTLVARRVLSEFWLPRHALVRAEKEQRAILEAQRRRLGREHRDTLATMVILARTLSWQARHSEAEYLSRQAIAINRRIHGIDHPQTVHALCHLASVLIAARREQGEAERILRRVLSLCRRRFGEDHPDTDMARFRLGESLVAQGKYAEAEPLYRASLDYRRRTVGRDHPAIGRAIVSLQLLLVAAGKTLEAGRTLEEQLTWLEDKTARPDPAVADLTWHARTLLGCRPESYRDPRRALALVLRADELTEHRDPAVLEVLAVAYRMNGQDRLAVRSLTRAVLFDSPDRTGPLTERERRLMHWLEEDLGFIGLAWASVIVSAGRATPPEAGRGKAPSRPGREASGRGVRSHDSFESK